uniref:WGS project CAEQ00000000 data, annotated contig 489 n=1 Tax=Trypanosoma congolense (strain IL3000) TaxID=1068625 RepID=F9WGC8_TRYCI|nr:unnamed protein product [Trypanosoma congolense IL3000]
MGGTDRSGLTVCDLLVCCRCRRTVPLEGNTVECTAMCPDALKADPPRSPTGGLWETWRKNRGCRKEAEAAQVKASSPSTGEQEGQQQRTLHPAIKCSRVTATGKYSALSPSPFSPWVGRKGDAGGGSGYNDSGCDADPKVSRSYDDASRVADIRAHLTVSLPLIFSHQYAWFSHERNGTYLDNLWKGVQRDNTASVPFSPASPTSSTWEHFLQRGSRNNKSVSLPLASLIALPPIAEVNVMTHRSPGTGASDTAVATAEGDAVEDLCSHGDSVINERGNEESIHQSEIIASPITIVCPKSPVTFPVSPPRRTPQGNAAQASATSSPCAMVGERQAIVASDAKGSGTQLGFPIPWRMGVEVYDDALSPDLSSVCKSSLAQFSQRLMRQVVHGSMTDLPLCLHCWTDSLKKQKESVSNSMLDAACLMGVAPILGKQEVTLDGCHLVKDGLDERRWSQQRIDNAQQQEMLARLSIRVDEADARAMIITNAQQEVAEVSLPTVRGKLEVTSRKLVESAQRSNANDVRGFFEIDDAIDGFKASARNALYSRSFVCNTSAMLLAFPINTRGTVGTIAGLRLGKYPSASQKRKDTTASNSHASVGSAPATEGGVGDLNRRAGLCETGNEFVTTVRMQQQLQVCYTRGLLDKRPDFVSVAEINNACGYLLLLLQHLIDWHKINIRSIVLHPNGEHSTVDVLSINSVTQEVSKTTVEFFIKEKFFAWKTFGKGCVAVANCVREITVWMKLRLRQMLECVQRSGEEGRSSSGEGAGAAESPIPITPPYVISEDKVDGFSLRHGEVSDDVWTIAMKKLLAVVQWCVVVSRDMDELRENLLEGNENLRD